MESMAALTSAALSLSRPFSLSTSHLHHPLRCLRLLSHSLSFPPNSKPHPKLPTNFKKNPKFIVRNSSSITAKPSSQLRKKRGDVEQDEKLRALRELFSKPGIGIDAYIIPSQDAHQVQWVFFLFCSWCFVVEFELGFVYLFGLGFRSEILNW